MGGSTAATVSLQRRTDLTFKHNLLEGRHGWLRLTPAYSVRLVEQILSEFGGSAKSVFEPFSGTGTTLLCAASRGLRAVGTDINPFLVWLGRTKARRYTERELGELTSTAARISRRLRAGQALRAEPPPLRHIERWWGAAELDFVAALRAEVSRASAGAARDLLSVAFCRTLMALSNAAFNHQSMSFKPRAQGAGLRRASVSAFVEQFAGDVQQVARGVLDNPSGEIRIEHLDACGPGALGLGRFDLLVTSPPYPNRMSYVRELRPYMYWLGFLQHARGAGELDWTALGGTWGVATSRLRDWQPKGSFVPAYLLPTLDAIRRAHPKNGELMARYVHKYFDDMFLHFQTASRLVRRGGTAHYVVGNSSFYGQLVPVERLYSDQLLEAGFGRTEVRALRKRNSKKELIEFHVVARR